MKCPACRRDLIEKLVGKITVDICQGGCGGLWFDNYELPQLDDSGETIGQELTNIEVDPAVKVDHQARRNCPRCLNVVMMRHFYSVARKVVVDQCAGCGGFWLDAGELAEIREQFSNTDAREQALADDFNRALGPELTRELTASKAEAEKVRHMTRFLRLSYFISGK